MSVYSIKSKGWRYDFVLAGQRYTEAWFTTKRKAQAAEADKRKEINEPPPGEIKPPTDMGFLELVNKRLDHLRSYNSMAYYDDCRYRCKPWVELWGDLECREITQDMIRSSIVKRSRVSAFTANRDLVILRSLFNFGKGEGWIEVNPTARIKRLRVEKKLKYLPPLEDIFKVIAVADADSQDYLWTIRETMARVSEVNRLCWDDVDLEGRCVTLSTRKKKGGDLTPRRVPMTDHLFKILFRRYAQRNRQMPWVFWHTYRSTKTAETCRGPYGRRKRLMEGLCRKAGVRHFSFHALRHSGASLMENANVPIGAIQRILGHERRSTTEIYLQSIGDSERQAMATFEEASRKSHTDSHMGVPGGIQESG